MNPSLRHSERGNASTRAASRDIRSHGFFATLRNTLLTAMALVGFSAARAEIELVGLLVTSQGTHFALSDTATGKTDWVRAGGNFAGYTLDGFDAKNDTLTLTRDGTPLRVRLKNDARIKSGRLELTGHIAFGAAETLEVQRATLLFDQENIFPLQDGSTYRITPTRHEDGNIRYAIAVERILAENKKERIGAPTVIALPGHPFKVQIGELGFAFTPR